MSAFFLLSPFLLPPLSTMPHFYILAAGAATTYQSARQNIDHVSSLGFVV
jgi:hypothetical protein